MCIKFVRYIWSLFTIHVLLSYIYIDEIDKKIFGQVLVHIIKQKWFSNRHI